MAEITEQTALEMQLSPNPQTGEVELLIMPAGCEDEHGWFMARADLIRLLSVGRVSVPHAKKASPIDTTTKIKPELVKS